MHLGLGRLAVFLATLAHCFGEALVIQYPAALECPQLSLAALGADPTGAQDATPALRAADSLRDWNAPGIIFVGRGRYSVQASITLLKPVLLEPGAVLDLAPRVTLTFTQGLSAGPSHIIAGTGSIRFPLSMTSLIPEWFGAKGDGSTDDSAALNRAFQAANDSYVEVVLGPKTYALGSPVVKGIYSRVTSQPGAAFRALAPGLTGLVYTRGGHMRPDLLPAFRGFSTAIKFDDVGMTDCYTPLITDGPFPCGVGMEVNADSSLIKFGAIRNCRTGVWVTTQEPEVIMQGLSVEGGEYMDEKGVGQEVFLWTAPFVERPPYWDHNFLLLRKVVPSQSAQGFAVVRSSPRVSLPFHYYELHELHPLPPGGKLLDTAMVDSSVRVVPLKGFKDGQLDYGKGDFNSIYFEGGTALLSTPLTLAPKPNSLAAFKSSNDLQDTPFANLLTVHVPQNGTPWQAGQTRVFYLYHQLAYLGQCLFLSVPGVGSMCTSEGYMAVTALTDNSGTSSHWQAPLGGSGSKYEVEVEVMACQDIPLDQKLTFQVSLGAPGAAPGPPLAPVGGLHAPDLVRLRPPPPMLPPAQSLQRPAAPPPPQESFAAAPASSPGRNRRPARPQAHPRHAGPTPPPQPLHRPGRTRRPARPQAPPRPPPLPLRRPALRTKRPPRRST